ncbi:hypothetical protein [Pseudomonas migulae]|uniref:Uncharacterized protein n=1 Tax=Pseudomonas migulae TaxID=78543 RepID=A0A1H5MCF2_9PSED|nr:hypothetical protein [Pseudomonas migulae]SEE86996.1 hypothetical protein SAMN04490194_4638 [Pseudomonas migulae]
MQLYQNTQNTIDNQYPTVFKSKGIICPKKWSVLMPTVMQRFAAPVMQPELLLAITRGADSYGGTLMEGLQAVSKLLSLASETVTPIDRKMIVQVEALIVAVGDLTLRLYDVGIEASMLIEGGAQ